MKNKHDQLGNILKEMKKVLVAYSGGVDSTFLLKVSLDTLGKENVLAVIAVSPTYPESEKNDAIDIAKQLGTNYQLIETAEFENEAFRKNPVDRCYHCKKELFSQLTKLSQPTQQIIDGSNLDDLNDFRPGTKAKREHGVRSPLQEAGLTKSEIRELSKELGLKTWDKPSLACLASRIPYGVEIKEEILKKVDNGEIFLRSLGFRQSRVRHYNDKAKIEVEKEQIPKLMDQGTMDEVVRYFQELGYNYVSIDLEGYRTGSMNEAISEKNLS